MKKHRDHLNLLCDISDLSNVLTGSADIESFLQQTVRLVSQHLDAHVCSIYLFEENTRELVLKATIGLNPEAVGKIRMKLGEGLVGLSLAQLQPVCEGNACTNPQFKYFKEAGEDRFASLLAVPIQRGIEKIGVLVVQHESEDFFTEIDIMALRALGSQLAGAIENAQLLMDVHRLEGRSGIETDTDRGAFFKAEIGSPGYALAPATVFRRRQDVLREEDAEAESKLDLVDFHRAVRATTDQLKALQGRFAAQLPESASLIFSAHFMILKDPSFIGEMIRLIKEGVKPTRALRILAQKYIAVFSASPHAYVREKVNDVEDLSRRLMKNLLKKDLEEAILGDKRIIIAKDLYPSDILKLASEEVKGIILVSGSVTSHVTILSRSLKIPLMLTDRSSMLNLPEGTQVLMDADIGNIYIQPSEDIVRQFEIRDRTRKDAEPQKRGMQETTQTRDGVSVCLLANINLLSETPMAHELKAEGIGLYRTEFPFLIRSMFPSEEEQVGIYKRLIDEMHGKPVTIRTLDVGGDKILSYYDAAGEVNPQLGLRSIRFSLRHQDIFKQQIRAILRAAGETDAVRIMFPMISSVDEFINAKEVVNGCIRDLAAQRLPHPAQPKIGMMVELPSVIAIMNAFVRIADFFSIGTNDLVQYMLAVDRTNKQVADYYQPWHPSVLRGLAQIVDSATRAGKEISVCGEMGRDPAYIRFLLGIGIRTLSIDPQYLPPTQKWISRLDISATEIFAKELLSRTTIREILKRVEESNSSHK